MKTVIYLLLFLAITCSKGLALEEAYFAGGCFWCMQPPFDEIDGVVETQVGYAGGHEKKPTYQLVSSGKTGHAETVKVVYDPEIVTYQTLLDTFWINIDPTVKNRQFCDVGHQYRSAIFYVDEQQKAEADQSLKNLIDSGKFRNIYTEITELKHFYPAEPYHQDYYKKNPIRFKFYKYLCGREQRLKEIWQ